MQAYVQAVLKSSCSEIGDTGVFLNPESNLVREEPFPY